VESATACVIQLDYYHRAHMCLALAKSLTAANLINANRETSSSAMARALSMFSTMELSIDDGFMAEEGQSEDKYCRRSCPSPSVLPPAPS